MQTNQQSMLADISMVSSSLEKANYDFYIAIDEGNIEPNWVETKSIDGYRVVNMADALAKLVEIHPECETVQIISTAATDMTAFTEPANVCYICGPDNGAEPVITTDHKIKLNAGNLWALECVFALWGRFQ